MLIYFGSGTALAAARRRRRAGLLDDCATACAAAARACRERLAAGGGAEYAEALEAAEDCRDACLVAAPMVRRGGSSASYAASLCTAACRDCADACARLSTTEDAERLVRLCREVESGS